MEESDSMDKEELIHELMHEAKLTKAQAKKSVEALFSVLADAAARGETIDLPEFLIETEFTAQTASGKRTESGSGG